MENAAQRAADLLGGGAAPAEPPIDLKVLHAKIGQLTLENDFFSRGAYQGGMAERNAMMDSTHALSISRQAQPGKRLLCAHACECGRSGADASPGRVTLGAPVYGHALAARPAQA